MAARPGEYGEPPVEADQRTACVQVAPRGLGDDDSDTTREPLHDAGEDQHLDARAHRAHHRRQHVCDQPDQQGDAATEPVRKRTGDQLPEGKPDEACGDRQLCDGGCGIQFEGQ